MSYVCRNNTTHKRYFSPLKASTNQETLWKNYFPKCFPVSTPANIFCGMKILLKNSETYQVPLIQSLIVDSAILPLSEMSTVSATAKYY